MKFVGMCYNSIKLFISDIRFKRALIPLLFAACSAFVPVSCLQDAGVSQEELMYGRRDSVKLSFGYSLDDMVVKSSVNETLVEDVNLYVTNELGDVVSYGYYSGSGSMETVILEKMKYTVYAIANAGREIHAVSASQIEDIVYRPDDISAIASPSGAVLMSGKTEQQLLEDGQQIVINLTRCVAKIAVKADYSMLNKDVDIAVKRVALKNVPLGVSLFADNAIAEPADAADGPVVENPDSEELSSGLVFYQFENMQGTLLPNNLEQSKKVWPQESVYSKTCSYIELEASYSSPRKKGDILYRFYLGTDMAANFDVIRNRMHCITVNFREDGAVDENSWRVDNSEIVDLVTSVSVAPSSYKFTELGETLRLSATVLPLTAANKILEWNSSDNNVAVVDAEGLVTAVGDGTCTIVATTTDGTLLSASCNIVVDSKIYVTDVRVDPQELELYMGETGNVSAIVSPADATVPDVIWSSSDEEVATVSQSGEVTALAAGNCSIIAASADDSSKNGVCKVTVLEREFSISPVLANLYTGESFVISYTVKPPVTPVFVSEDSGIASVDESGKVTAVAEGKTRIKVSANGKELYCTVNVVRPQIEFGQTVKVMYDGEEASLLYSKLVPSTAAVNVESSDASIVQIVESSASGLEIKALKEGSAVITVTIEGTSVSASCQITVEKLRIVPAESSFKVYNHFYYDVGYSIYPVHASSLGVEMTLLENSVYYVEMPDRENYPARLLGVDASGESLSLRASVKGRPDVFANMEFTVVNPSMRDTIKAVVNLGYNNVVADLGLDISPRAVMEYEITLGANNTLGTPGDNIIVDLLANSVTFPTPNGANGLYDLAIYCVGDDGYQFQEELQCAIEIYETLYLVGISKTQGTEKVSSDPDRYEYMNEIVAKWLAHPNSLFYPNGEVYGVGISFIYNDVQYDDNHTGVLENHIFEFIKGESYPLALDEGDFTYNGNNRPGYYHEFFRLEMVDNNKYQKHNGAYHYVYSRQFCSGFSNEPSPDWEKIFQYVYPKK